MLQRAIGLAWGKDDKYQQTQLTVAAQRRIFTGLQRPLKRDVQ
jgi:hypothetical protein